MWMNQASSVCRVLFHDHPKDLVEILYHVHPLTRVQVAGEAKI